MVTDMVTDPNEFLERRMITGLIVSTEYCKQVRRFWRDEYSESPELRRIARWCIAYFDKYEQAPRRKISDIYIAELKRETMSKDEAELVELILDHVSDEFDREGVF